MLSWNEFLRWFALSDTGPFLLIAAVFLAILLSGLIATFVARGTIRALTSQRDRDLKASAIAALVDVALEASIWNTLTLAERALNDRAAAAAGIQLRLLPVKAANVAADWAAYKLADMKTNSETFGYQLEPVLVDFRERLCEWQKRPRKLRKEFERDLENWNDRDMSERPLGSAQEAWIAGQHHEQYQAALNAATPGPNTEAHQIIRDIEALSSVQQAASQPAKTPEPLKAADDSFLAFIASDELKAEEAREAIPQSHDEVVVDSEAVLVVEHLAPPAATEMVDIPAEPVRNSETAPVSEATANAASFDDLLSGEAPRMTEAAIEQRDEQPPLQHVDPATKEKPTPSIWTSHTA